jgi:hypothetical protein
VFFVREDVFSLVLINYQIGRLVVLTIYRLIHWTILSNCY